MALSISLLGPPQVRLDRELVSDLRSDKALALLAYLAVESDRAHRREKLAGMLWPDYTESSARANLRRAVADLRHAIRDQQATPPYLHATRETVQFNTASDYWLDVDAFTDLAGDLTGLEQAVALYQGSFLEGFSVGDAPGFEEWALLKKEQLERQVLEMLDRLATSYERRGEYEHAKRCVWRQVERDPWNEQAHRRLMLLLAVTGQRSAALAQYETCRRLLAEELGAEPSEEIRETYALLLRGERPPELASILAGQEHPPRKVGECPYRGLAAFQEVDVPFFFGREGFVERLVVGEGQPMVCIVGSSGSGKSSAVFAGLLPRLRRSRDWLIVSLRPGAQPFHALANALLGSLAPRLSVTERLLEARRLADALASTDLRLLDAAALAMANEPPVRRLLLVVDQFEELYTLCPEPDLRRRFVDLLLTSLDSGEGGTPGLVLLLTMRADFMGQALAYRPFADALQEAALMLGPMNRDELRAAIEKPAEVQGAAFEAGVVERILDDVGEEPGNLPLLEFALTLLWERHSHGWLTHAGYEEIGRVDGALARYAGEVYAGLAQADQAAARQVFVQLVRPGEGTEDTRRTAVRFELGEEHWRLVQHLADKRLVVTGRDAAGVETVEVVHEAMIRSWGQLQGWMEADRAFRTWQERMRAALRQWQDSGQDEGALLRGAPLVEAEGWLAERLGELSEAERGFIQAGVALRERGAAEHEARRQRDLEAVRRLAESEGQRAEEQAQAAGRLRRRALLLAVASFLAMALAAVAFLAFRQADQSAASARLEAASRATAEAIALGERATADAAGQVALEQRAAAETARALEAAQRETAEAEAEARATQQAVAEEQARLATSRELAAAAVDNLHVDPERSALLALEALDTTDSLEARNALHQALPELRLLHTVRAHDATVYAVSFSPDGTLLASSGWDYTAKIWDASTYQLLFTLKTSEKDVQDVDWSPDGKRLATGGITDVIIWDPATGRELFTLPGESVGHMAGMILGVGRIDFSPDGTRLAAANQDGVPKVWDLATRTPILSLVGHAEICNAIAYSPDGTLLATGSDDGMVKVWDAHSGQELQSLQGHSSTIHGVAFSPDGTRLSSVEDSGVLKIWDVASGEALLGLTNPTAGGFRSTLFLPDGSAVLTTGYDGTARIWDAATGRQRLLLAGHTSTVLDAALSSDAHTLATAGVDGTVKTWDLGPSHEVLTLVGNSTWTATSAAYSPAGDRLAACAADGTIRIYDPSTGELVGTVRTDEPHSWDVLAYSHDGSRLAVGAPDGFWALWDLESGQTLATISGHTNMIQALSFSPDDRRLVTGSWDGTAKVWDLVTGAALITMTAHIMPATSSNWVFDVAFSPSGEVVASAGSDAMVRVWDSATGEERLALPGGEGALLMVAVAYSPDGKLLAGGQFNGPIRVWEADTGRLVRVLAGHAAAVSGLDFSADGALLASAGFDLLAKVWDVQSGQELASLYGNAGNVGGVNFSPDGTRVVTGGADGTTRAYAVSMKELVALAKSRLTRSLTTEECQKYLHVDECP